MGIETPAVGPGRPAVGVVGLFRVCGVGWVGSQTTGCGQNAATVVVSERVLGWALVGWFVHRCTAVCGVV